MRAADIWELPDEKRYKYRIIFWGPHEYHEDLLVLNDGKQQTLRLVEGMRYHVPAQLWHSLAQLQITAERYANVTVSVVKHTGWRKASF